MKNLFANVSFTFNNFYNNLNTQGQIIFSIIIFLILVLCMLLFITYCVQELKYKLRKNKNKKDLKKEIVSIDENIEEKEDISFDKEIVNSPSISENDYQSNDIFDIAKRVEEAINEQRPIDLTNYEEDQEKTAIISIDELMKRAKELEIIEDEETGINYLEKYNLDSSLDNEENEIEKDDSKKEVKAFRVSQVISPVYGIKKEVIESNNN